LRAFPFSPAVHDFISRYQRVYVVDQNRDAQMLSLLRLECAAEEIAKLRSIRHYDGLPIDARSVTDEIASQEAVN
jgi:2-oxoglutarate ferredoxin oxidoreductase subunit alpha